MFLRSEHLLNCSAEALWRLSFNSEFDRQHAMIAMRMREHEVLSCTTSGDQWQLHSRSTPSTPIPKFVQRFVPAFSTETTFTHRPGTAYGVGVLRASVMPEQIHMSFRLEVIPEPSGGCRRIMEWEVKIGGIGPIIERFVIREIRRSLDASARFINEYIQAEGGAISILPPGDSAALCSEPTATSKEPRKLQQAAAELNLTEHCNLKCAGCNHASHQLPKKFAVLTECQRDLMALSQVMHLDELKFVGGEPLLHPELSEFLRMARQTGIADQLTLVTNGVLLHKMPEHIYSLIDRLWISVYPSVKLQFDLSRVEKLCQDNGVTLWHKETPTFQLSLLNRRIDDAALVQEIYSQCSYAHLWSCHTIHEGRYYKCSPAPFVGARLKLAAIPYEPAAKDSVALHDNPHLAEELAAYLADERPLAACAYCVADRGRDIPSQQLNKAELLRELTADHTNLLELFHGDRIPKQLKQRSQV